MSVPRCPKCDAEMKPGTEVCPGCGETVIAQHTPTPVPNEEGAYYCYRHKHAVTRLRCGRCGRAICTNCVVIGPAGPRCRECGTTKIPLRARAVVHEAKMTFRGLLSGPMRFIWMIVLFSIVMAIVNTCRVAVLQRRGPDPETRPEFEQYDDAEP